MPTYKRPDLLRRALDSLIAQTYEGWICYVLDDSPGHEAKAVVDQLADRRIVYSLNEKNLGTLLNIDRAFHPRSFGSASFACVLEDDNLFRPTYFERNVSLFKECGLSVILSNAEVETSSGLTGRLIYNPCYTEGAMDVEQLYGTFFYSSGVYNFSVMWKICDEVDLQTSRLADGPVTGERLRTLRIGADAYGAMQPLVVWRDNGADSFRKKAPSAVAWRLGQIEYAMHERAIYKALFQWLKDKKLEDLAFNPVVGQIDGSRLRPIIRDGIDVPPRYQRITPREVLKLKIKVGAMLVAAKLLGIEPRFKFVGDRIESARAA